MQQLWRRSIQVNAGGSFRQTDNGGEPHAHTRWRRNPSVSYGDKPSGLGGGWLRLRSCRSTRRDLAPDDGARRASTAGGSPGADDPAVNLPAIVINETLPILTCRKWTGSNSIRTTMMQTQRLVSLTTPTRREVLYSDGMIREADDTVLRREPVQRHPEAPSSFALSSVGDDLYLFSANTNGELTG
jgi:hypothetical protein